jgi:uncharacterized protein YciW
METLPPPPYQGHKHFKLVHSRDLKIDPVALTAYGDRLEAAEKELPAIQARIDTLYEADDWRPLREISSPLGNLNRGLSAWLVAERRRYVDQTLHDAEADLTAWRRMSAAEQAARVAEIKRLENEAAERRKAEAVFKARHAEFYGAMKQMNVSPPRWLDNEIANWSLA